MSTPPHLPPAVCSWSLRPTSPEVLADHLRQTGLTHVQLALDPLARDDWPVQRTRAALQRADIAIVSGMIGARGEDYTSPDTIRATGGVRSDVLWPLTRDDARRSASIARDLGLSLVTFHAGFLPHDAHDPLRVVMIERLRELLAIFHEMGITLAFETGQETAETLLTVIHDLAALGPAPAVNFDPANMLLYGMGDPVAALRLLAPHVHQVHIKDAFPPTTPGRWGREVRVGEGAVHWPDFFIALDTVPHPVRLVIEREAGESRVADIRAAHAFLSHLGRA